MKRNLIRLFKIFRNYINMGKQFERYGSEIIKNDFTPEYQNGVGHFGDQNLHKNSLELIKIINKSKIIFNENTFKVLEIGAAGCRNLKYIQDEYNNIQFFANDLHKNASFKNMHDNIKNVINFYEEPTQTFIKKWDKNDFNLIIDSDHLVHINYTDSNKILTHINNIIQPK